MRPPTRIRDDDPSALARAMLDAARPVRAMSDGERAASAARVAQLAAAPVAVASAPWIKGLFGLAVLGVGATVVAWSSAPKVSPRAPSVAAPVTVVTRAPAVPPPPPAPPPPPPPAPQPAPVVSPVSPAPVRPSPPRPVVEAPRRQVRLAQAREAHPSPTTSVPTEAPTTMAVAVVDAVPVQSFGARVAPPPPRPLSEENRLLLHAHSARSRNPREALSLLREHRRRFPDGQHSADRDAQIVFVLMAMGERAEARAEAERYLQRYPSHPTASEVRARMAAP